MSIFVKSNLFLKFCDVWGGWGEEGESNLFLKSFCDVVGGGSNLFLKSFCDVWGGGEAICFLNLSTFCYVQGGGRGGGNRNPLHDLRI